MTEPSDWIVTEAMLRYGGGFVQTLGLLFRKADPVNFTRLRTTFADYWIKYRDIAINQKIEG